MLCIHCGKQINEGSAFCAICGNSQQPNQTNAPSLGQQAPSQKLISQPVVVSTFATQANSGFQGLLAANGLTQNVKVYEGLYTQIAVSQSGSIAIYYPHVPMVKGGFMRGTGTPEQPERLDVIHISQINDVNVEMEYEQKTKVSGGTGGAIVGGLLGGTVGSIIGRAATSGNVSHNTTVTGANLIINTKDFNSPRIVVRLFTRFVPQNMKKNFMDNPPTEMPYLLRPYYSKTMAGYQLKGSGKKIAKEVFNNGEVNQIQIDSLLSTLLQMLKANQQSEASAFVAPKLNTADELVKFKSLLDNGVITQAEFDSKKNQLMGG